MKLVGRDVAMLALGLGGQPAEVYGIRRPIADAYKYQLVAKWKCLKHR